MSDFASQPGNASSSAIYIYLYPAAAVHRPHLPPLTTHYHPLNTPPAPAARPKPVTIIQVMLQPVSKQAYLANLQARNRRNREVVETIFVPLNQAQRSVQPAPGEWSVDQCFQHLVPAFNRYVPNVILALNKPGPPHADGKFQMSWWARRTLE